MRKPVDIQNTLDQYTKTYLKNISKQFQCRTIPDRVTQGRAF